MVPTIAVDDQSMLVRPTTRYLGFHTHVLGAPGVGVHACWFIDGGANGFYIRMINPSISALFRLLIRQGHEPGLNHVGIADFLTADEFSHSLPTPPRGSPPTHTTTGQVNNLVTVNLFPHTVQWLFNQQVSGNGLFTTPFFVGPGMTFYFANPASNAVLDSTILGEEVPFV